MILLIYHGIIKGGVNMSSTDKESIMYISVNDIDEYLVENTGDYYSLLFVTEGLLFCTINGSKCQFGQGDLIFFRKKDEVSFLKRNGSNLNIYAIIFNEMIFQDLNTFFSGDYFSSFLSGPMPSFVKLRGIQCDKLVRELRYVKTVYAMNRKNAESTLRLSAANMVYSFFISKMETPNWLETPPEWFVEFYMLLSRHYVFTKPFSDIIALSGKSREYISRLFKSSTGINISDYIMNQRMGYACNLLKNSSMDVIDVSFECGFDNLSTFYHHFSQKIGTSPQKYRNIVRDL